MQVWRPTGNSDRKLPVVFWIHVSCRIRIVTIEQLSDELEGGAYITGYGSFPISIESLRPPSYSSASQPEFEATSAVQNHS